MLAKEVLNNHLFLRLRAHSTFNSHNISKCEEEWIACEFPRVRWQIITNLVA